MAPRYLTPGKPDRQVDQHRGEDHEYDVLRRRDVDVRSGDVPRPWQLPLAQPERQLDHMPVRRVLEDHRAHLRALHHRKKLVSRDLSGHKTPSEPSNAGRAADTPSPAPTTN